MNVHCDVNCIHSINQMCTKPDIIIKEYAEFKGLYDGKVHEDVYGYCVHREPKKEIK